MALIDYIKDLLGINLRSTIEHMGEHMLSMIGEHARRIEQRIIKSMIGWSLILVSIIFFAISIIYFLIEYLAVSKTIAFFLIAIILLLMGIIVKINK